MTGGAARYCSAPGYPPLTLSTKGRRQPERIFAIRPHRTYPDITVSLSGNPAAAEVTLAAWPDARAALLFGSRVRGDHLPTSDWNVAFITHSDGGRVTAMAEFNIAQHDSAGSRPRKPDSRCLPPLQGGLSILLSRSSRKHPQPVQRPKNEHCTCDRYDSFN